MPTWDKKRTSWNSVATGVLKKDRTVEICSVHLHRYGKAWIGRFARSLCVSAVNFLGPMGTRMEEETGVYAKKARFIGKHPADLQQYAKRKKCRFVIAP